MKYDLTAGEVMDFHARLSDLSRRRMPGVNFNVILDGLEVLAGGLALRRHYESIEEVVMPTPIKLLFSRMAREIDPDGNSDRLRLVVNGKTARAMGMTVEVQFYAKHMPHALAELRGDVPVKEGDGFRHGVPSKLYQIPIRGDDMDGPGDGMFRMFIPGGPSNTAVWEDYREVPL